MKDALRAARLAPAFLAAAAISFVEVSPVLRRVQREAQGDVPIASLRWLDRIEDLADTGPMIVLANEFFDALSIRQFVRVEKGWAERCIGLNHVGELCFGAAPDAINMTVVPSALRHAPVGSIVEMAPARSALAHVIAERLRAVSGAALVIDYGFCGPAVGDTLQAVRQHAYADVLSEPGAADVTSHVDFAALSAAFADGGVAVRKLMGQGDFLQRLGARERVDILKRSANSLQSQQLEAAYQRLTAPEAMGSLFKVLCAFSPASLQPAGFLDE